MDFQELTDLGDDRVTIRVAVVDVHPLFRRRVIGILQATEGIEVVSDRHRPKQFTLQDDATPLTVREEEILRELGTGAINKDIAQRLSIREHTVRFHVRNILNKLHMSNRVEAAAYARREGLVKE